MAAVVIPDVSVLPRGIEQDLSARILDDSSAGGGKQRDLLTAAVLTIGDECQFAADELRLERMDKTDDCCAQGR